MSERQFLVGDKVIVVSGYGYETVESKGRVSKVYKNGNFVIDDDKQQYRSDGWATGESYHRRRVIRADTEKSKKLLACDKVRRLKADILRRLNQIPDFTYQPGMAEKLKEALNCLSETKELLDT